MVRGRLPKRAEERQIDLWRLARDPPRCESQRVTVCEGRDPELTD